MLDTTAPSGGPGMPPIVHGGVDGALDDVHRFDRGSDGQLGELDSIALGPLDHGLPEAVQQVLHSHGILLRSTRLGDIDCINIPMN